MNAPDRATLRDWTYFLNHLAILVLLCGFVGTTCYIAILNARDKTPLCAPDTSPVKAVK